tara:strand:- start:578 stop:1021 length:444 start_codon:yes stop_codon:yes gene_type:complete
MADAVTTQVLQDGERLYIAKFTNISDGSGEAKVTKVDVSGLNPSSQGLACIGVKISKIYAQTEDMGVDIYWVGDPTPANDALAMTIPQGQLYDIGYDPSIPYNGTGALGTNEAGNVAFSTRNASSGDTYTIILYGIKVYAPAVPGDQ